MRKRESVRVSYLHVAVDADGRVVEALQPLKGHGTLLLIVEEENEDPSGKIQQHPHRRPFTDPSIRPERGGRERGMEEGEKRGQREWMAVGSMKRSIHQWY